MKTYKVVIKLLSPLHLGAGQADVVTDAEAVRDKYGIPFFPGKRLKGLLYESALEMAEISCGKWFDKDAVNRLFAQTKDEDGKVSGGIDMDVESSGIRVENFYLPDYEELCSGWEYLQGKYAGLFTALDVWDSYGELRSQTAIDRESGVAMDGSLRNIRVVDAGNEFVGNIVLLDDGDDNRSIVEKALLNLRYAGAKRNRGFGKIKCTVEE